MEHSYMHMKGHKRGHGTSKNLKVVAKSQMVLFGIIQIVRGSFMSLGLVQFHIYSPRLIHDQIVITEHCS